MNSNNEDYKNYEDDNEEQNELLDEEESQQDTFDESYNVPVNNSNNTGIGSRYIDNKLNSLKNNKSNNQLNKGMNGYNSNNPKRPNANQKDKSDVANKAMNKKMPTKTTGGNNLDVKKLFNSAEKAEEEGKSKSVAVGKEIVKQKIKQKVLAFVVANLPIILAIIGIILLLILLIVLVYFFVDEYENNQNSQKYYGCSTISMTETSLSKSEFTELVNNSNVIDTFKTNASKIYDIATNNKINPELVVIRAKLEGYSPGINNNYWGIGCFNGVSKCFTYNSFDQGVFEYIKNISRYGTVQEMLGSYSYIGDYWFNTSASNKENMGLGGCYYFPYIQEFMSEARKNMVAAACTEGRWCHNKGVGTCLQTTDEDQTAYAKWQVKRMVEVRQQIFNIGEDECEDEYPDIEIPDDGTLGSQVANYAIETFDSYSYSQDSRWSDGYVDCSSMVFRAYAHFGYKFGGNSTASTEFVWCKSNDKLISESELKAGDLIFFNKGSHYASDKAYGIGHVTMYIGNGKQFSARSSRYEQEDQVAVTNYSNTSGSYFCRPYK